MSFGITNSLYGFVLRAISGTMIPCALDISKRLQEFVELLSKNKNCLVAYIAPEYFASMRMSSSLHSIENDLQQLTPLLEQVDDQQLSEKINKTNQNIEELKEISHQLALENVGLYTINLPPKEERKDLEKLWNYYKIYKNLQKQKERLETLKEFIENRDIQNKNQIINKIDETIGLIDSAINSIPKGLRDYFKQRENLLNTAVSEIDLLDLTIHPDKLKGIPECLNFTRDIYCKQEFRLALCYMSFLGLYIEEMFASISASSQDNFIQDFARRLGRLDQNFS